MKKKTVSNLIKYVGIFLFLIIIVQLCSCELALKKAEDLSKNISFNYPGLRLETKYLQKSDMENRDPRIVCFGDSVTFGWNLQYGLSYPYLLEQHMKEVYPEIIAVNSGIGGNTIIDAKKRLESDVISFGPDLAIINFGLNDAMLDVKRTDISEEVELFHNENGNYYLPQIGLSEFERIYIEVLDKLNESGIDILVLGLTPALDSFPEGESEDFRRKQNEIFDVYNMRIISLAQDMDVDVIDLYNGFVSAGNLEDHLQQDGLHPSEQGQYLISIVIKDYLIENEVFSDAFN